MPEINSYINRLIEEVCEGPLLSQFTNPSELKTVLLKGISGILNRSHLAERKLYLADNPNDSGNGFMPERSLKLATIPIETSIPRTRSGHFYPSVLNKYERTIGNDYDTILLNLLLNGKNFEAVKRTIKSLGLPYRPDQLDSLINEIHEEAKMFYTRRISPDWYFVYIDAKRIDLINENKKLEQAVVFTVVGISNTCQKEVLSIHLFWGNESIDLWKKVLIDLKNRGLTRVMMIISDDFSGLAPVMKSLFPNADHQLCHVHLLRNALRHLTKEEYVQFKQKLDDMCLASDVESAKLLFLEMTSTLKVQYPAYAKHLHDRVDNFCAFAQFPRDLRPHIRSTNLVEGINNHIEIIQRNGGGLFHSERELFVKLKIMTDSLHSRKWKSSSPKIKAHIHELSRVFFMRFESEA